MVRKQNKKNKTEIKEIEHLKYNSNIKYEKAFKHLEFTNSKKKILKFTNLDFYIKNECEIKVNNVKIIFKNKKENIDTSYKINKTINLINSDSKITKFPKNNIKINSICNCIKNNCLKNYCICFKYGNICSNTCNCSQCKNISSKERQIIYKIKKIDKDFDRLRKRLFNDELINCNCKKGCNKNYCSCIKNNLNCDKNCICLDCKNN